MSRWDPKPTPSGRWIAGHLSSIRAVVFFIILLAIGGLVHDLVTPGTTFGDIAGPILVIVLGINLLYLSRQSARFVKKYDSTRDRDSHLK
jgi:hypothetical protein